MKSFFFASFKKIFIIAMFVISAVALFGIAHTFSVERDLTQNHRNSLTPATRALLKKLNQSVTLTLYGGDTTTEKSANDLIARINKLNIPMQVSFYPLGALPNDLKKQYRSGMPVLHLETSKTNEWLELPSRYLTEEVLIQALKEKDIEKPLLVFLEGHGERSLSDTSRDGLSEFKKQLDELGIANMSIRLAHAPLPEQTTALAIVGPKTAYSTEEINQVQEALEKGLRLIWLKDPTDGENFTGLQKTLGFEFQPGTLIDGDSASFDSPHPAIIFIRHYLQPSFFQNLKEISALPWAQSLHFVSGGDPSWRHQALITSGAGVWHELDTRLNPSRTHEPEGAQIVAASFERMRTADDGFPLVQRAVVMGDSDFISNGALFTYANSTLAERLFEWTLAPNPALSVIHPPASDRELSFTFSVRALIDYIFPIGIPLALFSLAFLCYRKRMV